MQRAFTDIFIKRPVLAMVVSMVIVLAGLQAIRSLTVRQYPQNENATVTVRTVYVGAEADLVRGFVTTPLERSIAQADGIEYISSQSRLGLSEITARLELNYDAKKALAEISSKVDAVRGDLPEEAEVPEITIENANQERAAAYLSFTSEMLRANEITDYLIRVAQPRISAISGVQQAEILGGRVFAMRAWLKPERMAALGVSATEVREALAANNFLSAVGRTRGAMVTANLTANTDINSAEGFRDLVIRNEGDEIIRLEDIAKVELGAENYDSDVRFSGTRAVFMGIKVQPDANTVSVIQDVREELESLKQDLPTGLNAQVAYDSTVYIDEAIQEVVTTLTETLLIVVLVIFFFTGSVRTVLVPAVVIPISLIGAVFLMQVFGFTINLLTLLAIVLSVGIVVDDAIIVVENVERHIRDGMRRRDAALQAARELVSPIIATTITLVAAYLPIAFQGGLTGSLFMEFTVTLAGAVVISSIAALTLSPMMSSKIIKRGEPRWLSRQLIDGFERLKLGYGRFLDTAMGSRRAIYAAWAALVLACVPMFMLSPKELAPKEDEGIIFGIVEAAANNSIEETVRYTKEANEVFFSFPETEFSFQITNPAGGFSGMVMKPWGQRDRTVFEALPKVRAKLNDIAGINMFATTPSALPGGGNFALEFYVTSTAEPERILEFAQTLKQKGMEQGMFAFPPIIDTKIDQPQTQIEIDRDKVAALGLDLRRVGRDVAAMVGGNFVNRFNLAGRSYEVIPQIVRSERLNPDQLKDIYIRDGDGGMIPLGAVAELRESVQPRSLNRFQQFNAVKIQGAVKRPLGEVLEFLEKEADRILPKGYGVNYAGESRQLRKEGSKFLPAFAFAIILIFLVLSAQYNSFRDPFVILLGAVPLATFAALIFTFLRMLNPNIPFWTDPWTTTLNIYSQVGLVTLTGLVAKNGILIVEFANQLQREGRAKIEAVQEAATIRLRPILMTSVATVAGHFPLVLASGAGAEARNSIGLVVVGGMAIGGVFTLVFVPTLYVLIAREHNEEAL